MKYISFIFDKKSQKNNAAISGYFFDVLLSVVFLLDSRSDAQVQNKFK